MCLQHSRSAAVIAIAGRVHAMIGTANSSSDSNETPSLRTGFIPYASIGSTTDCTQYRQKSYRLRTVVWDWLIPTRSFAFGPVLELSHTSLAESTVYSGSLKKTAISI